MGVYQWIREGVRQAVLLGFSDAVEQIGVPSQGEQVNQGLLSVLRKSSAPAAIEAALPLKLAPSGGGRKRLGKTFDQVRQSAAE